MNQFRIVLIVLVICISSINGQIMCPTGIESKQNCSKLSCPPDSICYRSHIFLFCCGALDKFCPTKMHAFNSEEDGSYIYFPYPPEERDEWYGVHGIGKLVVISCPIPFSFAYSLYKELKVLPVDFDANNPTESKPKACIYNMDCKTDNDEFCGAAYHPAFPRKLDGSGIDRAPLKFCYKFKNFGSANVKPLLTDYNTDLMGCASDKDCLWTDIETFCQRTEKSIRIAGKETFTNTKGFCAIHPKSGLSWYMLAVLIVGTVICLFLSITCYITHRKSVVKKNGSATKTESTNDNGKTTTASSGL